MSGNEDDTMEKARPLPPCGGGVRGEGRVDTQAPVRLHAPYPLTPAPQGGGGIYCRPATPADAAALAKLAADTFCETFAHLYPPEDLAAYLAKSYGEVIQRGEIEDPAVATWLAFNGEALIGYAQAGPLDMKVDHAPTDRELYRLYVTAEAKGAGVAQALMDRIIERARTDGAEALWLSVWENNERAQKFYRRFGFAPVGEHKFMVGATADRDFIWRLAL